MPLHICKMCIKTIFYCHEFTLKCRKSEKVLQTVLALNAKHLNDEKEEEATLFYNTQNESGTDALKDLNKEELVSIKEDEYSNDALNYTDEVDDFFNESFSQAFINDNETKPDCNTLRVKVDRFFNKSFCQSVSNDNKIIIDYETPNANLWETQEAFAVESNKNNIKNPKIRLKKLVELKQRRRASSKVKCKFKKKKGPPYTCITCHALFETREDLKKHKIENNHRKSLKYTCEHCKKMYDTRSKYVEHCRIHTGEKPNICQACGKAFNFKTDLKRHMFMHEKNKPYACRHCEKSFTRKQYLLDHERKHTGEKLICPFCGRGFHSHSTLVYHEKAHKVPPATLWPFG